MGDQPKKPEEGEDLLSKLFDEPDGQTEVLGAAQEPFGGATRSGAKSDDQTDSIAKSALGKAFEVSTGELNKSKPASDPSRTEFMDADQNPFHTPSSKTQLPSGPEGEATEFQQADNLFDNVLGEEPLPSEKISFFESPKAKSAQPFQEGSRENTIVLGEDLGKANQAPALDPIEQALNDFQGEDPTGEMPKAAPEPVQEVHSEEPLTLEAPSEISSSDFEPRSADQIALEGDAFRQKSEVKAEDFAEVFANDPIPVSAVQSKKSNLWAQARKVGGAVLAAGVLLAIGLFGLQMFRSDTGILGYRLDGFSVVKAYKPPSAEESAQFQTVFKESEKTLLSDSPLELAAGYTKLKSIFEKDERNAEAVARMMDHSAVLIGWYGTASPWSQRFDESMEQINQISQKSKEFVDNLVVERAKARRSVTLGDLGSARSMLEKALQRFNVGDDSSFLLLAEICLQLNDLKSSEHWLAQVSDKTTKRARMVTALVKNDARELQALGAEGYLPARIIAFTSASVPTKADEINERLAAAESLMSELKELPTLALKMKEYKGDLHQAAGESAKARELWKAVLELYPKDLNLWMKLASSFEQDALWDDALSAYQGMERAGGLTEKSLQRYAELLRIRGRHLDAAGLITKGLEKYPKSAQLLFTQGRVLLDLYQVDPAKEAFNKALAADPKFELATLGLVDIAMQRRETTEAQRLLKQISSTSPNYAMALTSLGRLELMKGNLKEAENLLTEAVKVDPKAESVYPQLVDIQLRQERDDEAARLVDDGRKYLPKSPQLTMAKARVLQFQREYEKALSTIEPIRKTHDHLAALKFLTVDLLIDAKNYREAADEISKLVSKEVRDNELNYLRAKMFYKDQGASSRDLGSAEMAMKLLDGAIRQNPSEERYRILMGHLALRIQDRQAAQEQIDAVLRVNPKSAEALALQGDFQMDLGNYEAASKSFKLAVQLTRFRSEFYGKLAECFKQLGQTSQAIEYYKKVTGDRPRDADALLELGKLYNQEGRFQGALASFKRAVALNPKLAEAYYFLGFIQKEMGDPRGALSSFEAFLALEPTSTESATIRDEIYFLKNGHSPN